MESFRNTQGYLEEPTYEYDKNLDHIDGYKEKMNKRYKLDEPSK